MELGMFIFCLNIIFMIWYLIIAIKQHKDISYIKEHKDLKNKKIALLLPCYNEGAILKTSIEGIKRLSYQDLEVIFINDGSKDNSLEVLSEFLDLEKNNNYKKRFNKNVKYNYVKDIYKSNIINNVYVIDKVNGGKADSLNAGIDFTDKDYVITLDADSVLKSDALEFINDDLKDNDVIAIGGNVMVLQGIESYKTKSLKSEFSCSFLEYAQFMEYLSVFYIIRNALCRLKSLAIISGAFGVFDRKVLLEVGCFEKTIGEDMDISIKFNQYAIKNKKKIFYDDRAICFTEAPTTIKDFCKQRVRWQKGLMDILKKHKTFFFKNLFKSKMAMVTLFDVLILGYISVSITLIGIIYLIYKIIESLRIGDLLYLEISIGILIFVVYSIINVIIARDNNLSFSNVNKFKILMIHIYILFVYKPLIMVVTIYGSIEYLFKKGGWGSIKRSGVDYSVTE